MAMLEESFVPREELKRQFEAAAAAGKYLLLISEGTNDEMLVTRNEYVREVSDAAEALALLQKSWEFSRAWDGVVNLETVFEPGKTYEECFATPPEQSALGDVVRQFNSIKARAVSARPEPESKGFSLFGFRLWG